MTIDVCAIEDLPDGEVAVVEVPGFGRIAVFNTEGGLYGIEDRCSHQEAWLSDGFLDGCAVECPLHASLFDLKTGEPSGPPAQLAIRTFAIGTIDGRVVVLEEAS